MILRAAESGCPSSPTAHTAYGPPTSNGQHAVTGLLPLAASSDSPPLAVALHCPAPFVLSDAAKKQELNLFHHCRVSYSSASSHLRPLIERSSPHRLSMRLSSLRRTSRFLSLCPSCYHTVSRRPSVSRYAATRCAIVSLSPNRPFSTPSFNASLDEWKRFNSAGLTYLSSGQLDQAEQMFIAALRSSQHLVTSNQQHNSVPLYLALSNLATAQRLQGKIVESKSNARQALDQVRGMRKEVGAETVGHMQREYGLACEALGEWKEARQSYVEAEKCYRDKIQQVQSSGTSQPPAASASTPPPSPSASSPLSSPSDLPSLLREHSGCLFAVGVMSERLDELPAAIEQYSAALEQAKLAWGDSTVNVAEVHVAAGKALLERGRREGSEQWTEAGREQLMAALTIYQERQDKKLLEVLPVYLNSLQAMEGVAEIMEQIKRDEAEAGRDQRKTD